MPGSYYIVVLWAVVTTATGAFAQGDLPTSCASRDFDNVYYLLGQEDFIDAAAYLFSANNPQLNFTYDTNFIDSSGQRHRTTTFYDFDSLALRRANKELVHTVDNNLPDYRIEKEQISYRDKLSTPAITQEFEVKKYKKKTLPLDKHPFFSRVKRKDRPILINHLSTVSKESAESIAASLQIESMEKVLLVSLFGIPHAAFTLSQFTISSIGVPNTSWLLKIEIFSDEKDNLKKHEKEHLHAAFCRVNETLRNRFPHVQPYSWFGYTDYNKLAMHYQPAHELFRQYPAIYSIGQIICLIFTGFLFIYFILGRYSRQACYDRLLKISFCK